MRDWRREWWIAFMIEKTMTDIVERLRWCGKELADHYSHAAIFDQAADEIERLRQRVEFVPSYKVRCDALEEAAKVATSFLVGDEDDSEDEDYVADSDIGDDDVAGAKPRSGRVYRKHYSVKATARELRMSERRVRRAMKNDEIRFVNFGGRAVIPGSEVQRLSESMT